MEDRPVRGSVQPGEKPPAYAGLCDTCFYAKWVQNDRGSRFLLCLAHGTHPEMPRYPPLPVQECAAYEEREQIARR
jgi:hypothetical protein